MLSWFFKKRADLRAPTASNSSPPASPPQAAADKAVTKARQIAEARSEWTLGLQAAQGDDAALLRVAQGAPLLEIKLAAVEALITEDALKQAEREFRSHDRRVHQAAKRRLEAAVAQRETRTRAQKLIEAVTALMDEPLVPVNRLVALDRDWQALDPGVLDAAQAGEFSERRARLDAAMRDREDQQRRVQRWVADAQRALAELQRGLAETAARGTAGDVARQVDAVRVLRQTRPDASATGALDQTLQTALLAATQVEARLAWLDAPARRDDDREPAAAASAGAGAESAAVDGVESRATEPPTASPVEGPSTAEVVTPEQVWRGMPPLADSELARLLDQRFEQWQDAAAAARPSAEAAPAMVAPKPPRPAAPRGPSAEQRHRLDTLLQQAEDALAAGQLGELQQQLQAVDAALEAMSGVLLDDALRARCRTVQAERARLRGWKQWGGARAVEGLVEEAEALARSTLAAADAELPGAPRLHLKEHREAIHMLRQHWKELDHQGAPASAALWRRFDEALQAAYQPVAAQQAALKAERQQNLLAREALLATLEALPAPAESATPDEMAAFWKEQLRALDRFHTAWRQLGPLEHTVPHGARSALEQRLRSSVDRVEVPLQEARRSAEAARESLIVQAEALLQDLRRDPSSRDVVPRLRELQAEWRQHARALPLARTVESALWTRFKAAGDALFAQRDAAWHARDAELAANLAAREALLERLSTLAGDAPAAEVQRTLAEVDRAWRLPVDLPRGATGAIEARFHDARAAAMRNLTDGASRRWQAQCDTLVAKLALCDDRERAGTDEGDLARRWAALDALPAPWEHALEQRRSRPIAPGPLSETALDELLLALEAALDVPAAPSWQDARRSLKLRALKDALEGRASPQHGAARQTAWLIAALGQSGTTTTQHERLQGVVAALRKLPAGSLAAPLSTRVRPDREQR